MPQERFKLPVGVFIMLRQGNDVLLQLRKGGSLSGYWGFVGGHLDGNEQIVAAAIREAKEEIGIDIHPEDLALKLVYHTQGEHEYLQFYFECSRWEGQIENKEPDRCEKLAWYAWDSLPKNTCPYSLDAVEKINAGMSFYEEA